MPKHALPINYRTYIDRIAEDMGVKYNTRGKWRERGKVSWEWRHKIFRQALSEGITIPEDVFDDFKNA